MGDATEEPSSKRTKQGVEQAMQAPPLDANEHVGKSHSSNSSASDGGPAPIFDLSGGAAETLSGLADSVQCFGLEIDEEAVANGALGIPSDGALARSLTRVRAELLKGRGLALLRGLEWPEDPALRRLVLLALCTALRMRPVLQSTDFREIVADVRARPPEEGDRISRGYRNPYAQKLHTDSNRPSTFGTAKCDVLVMLCVRQSDEGGTSKLLSADDLHNTIATERPDLYERLCAGWPWNGEKDWMPEWGPMRDLGEGLPLLSGGSQGVRHAVQYGKILRQNVEAGFAARVAQGVGVAMTSEEREALDFLETVANREGLLARLRLAAGEVLLLNNYAWMHGRDAFPEEEADGNRRHMLRVWLKV